MKDYAFPQVFRPVALVPAKPGPTPASPFNLSSQLLGDLAILFERESNRVESNHERSRLYGISRELDRLWRVKASTVRR
jgi:hypothetical protein